MGYDDMWMYLGQPFGGRSGMAGELGFTYATPGVWMRVCSFISRFFQGSHGKEVTRVVVN